MKYLKIFLSILIVIILGIYLFYTKSYSLNEHFQVPTNQLFSVKDIVDEGGEFNCALENYRYPEPLNQEIQKNKIRYIIDSNLYQLNKLKAFTIMYQQDLTEIHSKTFSGGEKLVNVSLMGCGEFDLSKGKAGIEIIGSDLFLNNLGKRKPPSERPTGSVQEAHHFALNLFEGSEVLPIFNKKKIIIYPETILRLTTLYSELLDGVTVTSETTPSGTTAASSPSVTLDQILNSEIIDYNIYNLLYEKPMTDNEFRVLLFRVLGIEEELFDENNMNNDIFKIVKTNSYGDCPSDDEGIHCYYRDLVTNCGNINTNSNTTITTYGVDILKKNFRFVYYKDVMFSTDVAFWRTNIYNKLQETNPPTTQPGTSQSISIPEHIEKFTVFSSVENQRENVISSLLKISDYRNQIKILSNLNKYGKIGNEVIIKQNRDALEQKIQHLNMLILSYTIPEDLTSQSTPASEGDLINLNDIVRNGINSTSSGCEGCEDIQPKINQNGELVPPKDFEQPEYVTNIYPPYPTVEPQVCLMTTSCIESFTSQCRCQTYKLSYEFNNKTETFFILVDGIIDIDNFSSMYTQSEVERFRLLKLNIALFNPNTPVNAGQKFIDYAQLFHNIPTQLDYISNVSS